MLKTTPPANAHKSDSRLACFKLSQKDIPYWPCDPIVRPKTKAARTTPKT